MNTELNTGISYDAPVHTRDTDKMYRAAMQDPDRRIALIRYLKSHGLLSDPSHQRVG